MADGSATPERAEKQGRSQFIGAAGRFHVAYGLTIRQIHAAITLGNMPRIDLIAADNSGLRQLSLQVKTSKNAYRKKRYGFELREWDVGASVIDHHTTNLWYALVDLQADNGRWNLLVFFVPSLWVSKSVKPDWGRKIFMLRAELWPSCQDKWNLIPAFLNNDLLAISWCETVPKLAVDWN